MVANSNPRRQLYSIRRETVFLTVAPQKNVCCCHMAQFWRIRIIGISFGWIYTNLDGFKLIYTRFNMFIFVFDVFMNLVCPIIVPQAFFFRGKRHSLIFGLCQFWKLSELSEFQYIRILGPVEKDACRKITNSGGTKTSRFLMVSQLVNKTMNCLLLGWDGWLGWLG